MTMRAAGAPLIRDPREKRERVSAEFGHGERNYAAQMALVNRNGAPLPAGNSEVEAWLANSAGGEFRAATAFRIATEQVLPEREN